MWKVTFLAAFVAPLRGGTTSCSSSLASTSSCCCCSTSLFLQSNAQLINPVQLFNYPDIVIALTSAPFPPPPPPPPPPFPLPISRCSYTARCTSVTVWLLPPNGQMRTEWFFWAQCFDSLSRLFGSRVRLLFAMTSSSLSGSLRRRRHLGALKRRS